MTLPLVRTLDLQPWMVNPATLRVMTALNLDNDGPDALFVGGCVRHAVLGLTIKDIDIATAHEPNTVMDILQDAEIRAIPTGIEHGTVTAVIDGHHFEITSLRRDVETDGRRAVVAFTQDWREDARRRDFTMNTLLMDLQGQVYDPLGRGLDDLEKGRVVFVGDPAARIAEDTLRILRFFRFHAIYGRDEPDESALRASRAAADKIPDLSRERITQEVFKILMAPRPADTLNLMFETGVLEDLLHAAYVPDVLRCLEDLQDRYERPSVLARLVALAGFEEDHLDVFDRFFVFSRKERTTFKKLVSLPCTTDEKTVKALIYKEGADMTADALLLNAARMDDKKGLEDAIALIRTWDPPVFPLSGHDVEALGLSPGPQTGRLLKEVQKWWIEEDFRPGREECLQTLQSALAAKTNPV